MKPNPAVVYIVVGSLAYVLVAYATALFVAALRAHDVPVPEIVLTHFKEIAIFAGGAVAGVLARTSNQPDEPSETKIVNKPSEPVPTEPQ